MMALNNLICGACSKPFHKPASRILDGANYCCLQCAGRGRAENNAAAFWSKSVLNENECRIWQMGLDKNGYGKARFFRKQVRAHRLAWQLANGREIPEGMLVCHTCDNPSCVAPDHLFLGTGTDNQQDMILKGRKSGQLNGELRLPIGKAIGNYAEVAQRLNVSATTVFEYRRLYRANKPYLDDAP
jgi:hypothetical protein